MTSVFDQIVKEMGEKEAEIICSQAFSRLSCTPSYLAMREKCQSPIERLMLTALWTVGVYGGDVFASPKSYASEQLFVSAVKSVSPCLLLGAQPIVGEWRPDFALWWFDEAAQEPRDLLIECDGFDFHDRTKEHAQRDKSRDRKLIANGHHVIRFTGSEIWADAASCAREAIQVAYGIHHERMTAFYDGVSAAVDAHLKKLGEAS